MKIKMVKKTDMEDLFERKAENRINDRLYLMAKQAIENGFHVTYKLNREYDVVDIIVRAK